MATADPNNPLNTGAITNPATTTTAPLAGGTTMGAAPAPTQMTTTNAQGTPAAPTVAQAPVTTASLTTANQPTAGLVSNNVTSLIDQNSPLMQRAAAKAAEQANARGMLNSSMAVGDVQNAVIANATQIAQSDAASANQFALTNAQASNANAQFNAGQTNTVGTTNAGAINTQKGQLLTAGVNMNQVAQSASTQHDQQVAAIMADPNMTSDAKNAAIATLNANFLSFQKAYGSLGNLVVTGLLDFSAPAATTSPGAAPVPGSNAAAAASGTPAGQSALLAKQQAWATQYGNLTAQLKTIAPTIRYGRNTIPNPAYTSIQSQISALGAMPTA